MGAGKSCDVYRISIHALLAESDFSLPNLSNLDVIFLSTLSLRRATSHFCVWSADHSNFYPRSPCGERQKSINLLKFLITFLSTLSLRRATLSTFVYIILQKFLSTLSLRRATPVGVEKSFLQEFLSTLSLRRATHLPEHPRYQKNISIHALLAESDNAYLEEGESEPQFLSTLSLRRATHLCVCIIELIEYFYPRSPCGERHTTQRSASSLPSFLSTLSLRRATQEFPCLARQFTFLSTLSLRRATRRQTYQQGGGQAFLSTLSLRRATWLELFLYYQDNNFYPRSPCGERHVPVSKLRVTSNFYPRSPCGERRPQAIYPCVTPPISIHALLAESDIKISFLSRLLKKFLSTLSLRRATVSY